jgi:S-adenosylmethionine synthetase
MYLWTSEAVSAGHPDKVADQLADSVLDAHLQQDPRVRVACEVTCCKNLVLVTGEISKQLDVDICNVIRERLIAIGYDRPEHCYDGHNVPIFNAINAQSEEIAKAVAKEDGELGAGDQGMMFGFACNETRELMPLAHTLAFCIIRALQNHIDENRLDDTWGSLLLPDAKSQVTVEYNDDGTPSKVHTVVVSTQHKGPVEEACRLVENLVRKAIPDIGDAIVHFNPAGEWHLGGPAADTGLSGRKIVVDNYGADCPIGGGSFSGKDPTKVDRSGAYAARHIAKNLVAAGVASKAQVQVSYAIGMVEPVSLRVQTFGTSRVPEQEITALVRRDVPLSPRAIIDRFDLRRPIYTATASGGHFGRSELPWERLDLVETFREKLGNC